MMYGGGLAFYHSHSCFRKQALSQDTRFVSTVGDEPPKNRGHDRYVPRHFNSSSIR